MYVNSRINLLNSSSLGFQERSLYKGQYCINLITRNLKTLLYLRPLLVPPFLLLRRLWNAWLSPHAFPCLGPFVVASDECVVSDYVVFHFMPMPPNEHNDSSLESVADPPPTPSILQCRSRRLKLRTRNTQRFALNICVVCMICIVLCWSTWKFLDPNTLL